MMIVGWYVGGSPDEVGQCALCVACASPDASDDPGAHPITMCDEADAPTHCESCGALIPHALTLDGLAYVRDECDEWYMHGWGDLDVLLSWADEYAVPFCPDVREAAADWHGGQWTALYALASTGAILPGLADEIAECDDAEAAEILRHVGAIVGSALVAVV